MNIKHITLILLCLFSLSSCEKFLDENPNKQLTLPGDKAENLLLMLDNTIVFNQNYPSIGEIASDNVYIPQVQWDNLATFERTSSNAYTWQKDLFNDNQSNDWSESYHKVFNANIVLEAAGKLTEPVNPQDVKNARGIALFFRAITFYQLLQEFAPTFDAKTSASDLGIVLKTDPDINANPGISSVSKGYEQIFSDLKTAAAMLPLTQTYKTRPSKPAAWAALARTYLQTGDYASAREYADSCIAVAPALIDYNSLSTTAAYPIARYNAEVVWHGILRMPAALTYPYSRVDESLYTSYAANDLRKTILYKFNGTNDIAYKGSYDGSIALFGGLSVNEMYLISAECSARLSEISRALTRLNTLLEKRWRKGTFVPVSTLSQPDALRIILEERRKELSFRNIRWADLKRLNKEPAFTKTINRNVNNRVYALEPNTEAYVFPLPQIVSLLGKY